MLEDSNKRVIEENKSLLAKYESEREKLLLLTEKIEKLYKESTLNLLHGSSIYMKTKEKEFRHGPFLELQLYGRTLSARKNAMKKSIRN